MLPVGLLLNLLIWNQHEPLGRLALGGLVILGAVWISRLGNQPGSGAVKKSVLAKSWIARNAEAPQSGAVT